jgi:hypothetical protein
MKNGPGPQMDKKARLTFVLLGFRSTGMRGALPGLTCHAKIERE